MTIKQRINQRLLAMVKPEAKIITKFKDDDRGVFFATIFLWQEVKKYSESALEAAWKTAVAAKVVSEDEDLRDLGQGEHIISDSRLFSFIAKVDNPRQSFDQEAFIRRVATKYKLDPDALAKIAVECVKDSKPPLSKRILEVGS